jgi:hypothetical protein
VADARLTAALLLLVGACGPAGPATSEAAAPAPSPAPPAAPRPELPDSGWGLLSSARFSLELPLPDRAAWQLDDRSTPWLRAAHAATRSELLARTWRAARTVRRSECESQARLWRPATPELDPDSLLERRELDAPPGWSTELAAAVRPLADQQLEGVALAFGASAGRCLAILYTTRDSGPGAEAAIGRRLALVTAEVIPRVRLRSIDERVR